MRGTLPIETIREILHRRKDGQSYNSIAKDMGLSPKTPRRYCVLYGVDTKEKLWSPRSDAEVGLIKDLYINKGHTPYEISIQTSIPHSTVKAILKREGLTKPRNYGTGKESFKKALPKPIEDTIFYPERKVTYKSVEINGKRYIDVSEVYGL